MVTLSVVFGERKGGAAQPKCFRGVIGPPKATAKKKVSYGSYWHFIGPASWEHPLIAMHKWMP